MCNFHGKLYFPSSVYVVKPRKAGRVSTFCVLTEKMSSLKCFQTVVVVCIFFKMRHSVFSLYEYGIWGPWDVPSLWIKILSLNTKLLHSAHSLKASNGHSVGEPFNYLSLNIFSTPFISDSLSLDGNTKHQ